MEEDIQLLPTSSERVSTGREDPTKEVISTDTEVRRCSYNKVGRCKIHGDGARKVPVMVNVPVEGEGGMKTTKGQKKYIWRCDISRGGKKMKQTSLSSFLTARHPEMTAGVENHISKSGNSLNTNSVGQKSDERIKPGEVQ